MKHSKEAIDFCIKVLRSERGCYDFYIRQNQLCSDCILKCDSYFDEAKHLQFYSEISKWTATQIIKEIIE